MDPLNFSYFVGTLGMLLFTGLLAKVQRDLRLFGKAYHDLENQLNGVSGK